MNKSIFFIFSVFVTGLVLSINFYFGNVKVSKSLAKLEDQLIERTERQLISISSTVREPLLQGNIKGARIILNKWREEELFENYSILEENHVIDTSLPDNRDRLENVKYRIIEVPIRFNDKGPLWGSIRYIISLKNTHELANNISFDFRKGFILTAIFLLLMAFLLFLLFMILTNKLVSIFEIYLKEDVIKPPKMISIIWGPMLKILNLVSLQVKDWKSRTLEMEKSEEISRMAAQVSHDIRSPLIALNESIKNNLTLLPEEERLIIRSQIQRIQDIANELILKRKSNLSSNETILVNCLEEMITEKRFHFRQYLDLHLEADLDNSYGIFAKVDIVEFKRVLSNLINNSFESYDDKKGIIRIRLFAENIFAKIVIEDFGKGIPSEVLKKLGTEGITYGKEKNSTSGSGLGIYHAKKTIEEMGGSLQIDSEVGKGTTVILTIPRAATPPWFVSKIDLVPDMAIHTSTPLKIKKTQSDEFSDCDAVFIEDSPYLRRAWERSAIKANIKLLTFANPEEFQKYESLLSKERCEIYIDQNLGDGWPKGNEIAMDLHLKGFIKIILATGEYPELFKHLTWLNYRDKEPPWS